MDRKPVRPRTKNPEVEGSAPCVTVNEQSRTIYLVGDVGDEMVALFLPMVRKMDDGSPITIVVSSDGGDIDAGFAIYDAMTLAKSPIRVEGFGRMFSMAVLLLQGGAERYLSPNCSVMIHDGTVGSGKETLHVAQSSLKQVMYLHRQYCQIVANRTGLPLKKVMRMSRGETYMDASKAVELGFADGIIEQLEE